MYLIFDSETTGLPRSWKAPVSDLNNWPRVVELAWFIYGASEKLTRSSHYIVRPDGFTVPAAASKIHGITTERAFKEGHPIEKVLREFSLDVREASVLIAHNMSFDEKVVTAEFLRQNIENPFTEKPKICTKEASTQFCELPGPYGYKWPTLAELHHRLFDEDLENAHNALSDVTACAKCFFELKRLGVIAPPLKLSVR
jgi:DNA polymerase III subunit epsilon